MKNLKSNKQDNDTLIHKAALKVQKVDFKLAEKINEQTNIVSKELAFFLLNAGYEGMQRDFVNVDLNQLATGSFELEDLYEVHQHKLMPPNERAEFLLTLNYKSELTIEIISEGGVNYSDKMSLMQTLTDYNYTAKNRIQFSLNILN